MKTKAWAWAGPILGVALFSLAVWALHRELSAYHFKDILHRIGSVPTSRIAAALLLTAAGYGIMTIYDLLALRYLKQSLAYAKIAMAAFIGAAFSNNIGLSMLAGAGLYNLVSERIPIRLRRGEFNHFSLEKKISPYHAVASCLLLSVSVMIATASM